jgi:hypothetical protein
VERAEAAGASEEGRSEVIAAIYCRKSTEDEHVGEDESVERQAALSREYIEGKGWSVGRGPCDQRR